MNRLPGLLCIASDGEDPVAINELLSEVNVRDASVRLVLYPRGVGVIPWDKTFWKGTLRNAMHTGQTVDSMCLADVQVAVEAPRREPPLDSERIMLAGQGISGVLGLYAAVIEDRYDRNFVGEPSRIRKLGGPGDRSGLRLAGHPACSYVGEPLDIGRVGGIDEILARCQRLAFADGEVQQHQVDTTLVLGCAANRAAVVGTESTAS